MKNDSNDEGSDFKKSIEFLNAIGIQTQFRKISETTFLPGLLIRNGTILIDEKKLQYPGDILHEAGHLAVVPAADRNGLTQQSIIKRKNREAEEMMSIAWSYAVCMHLEIDPTFVFHVAGYRDGSSYITDSCQKNEYYGLPMLQEIGMTAIDENARRLNIPSYPFMIKWLRD